MPSSATASESAAGPAHVATVSFLASRAVPSGGFWVALAGGTALARVAQRRGIREGYGASVAATLETVAIMGPARFGVPFTQAVSAPLLGTLEARGWRPAAQIAVCALLRVLTNAVGVSFFIFVIAGGLDAYAGSYDALAGRLGFDVTERVSLIFTAVVLVGWGIFASVVQVGVYRRGLRGWPDHPPAHAEAPEVPVHRPGRFDPRAIVLAAVLAFALLLTGTEWPVLGAVAAWLALAWATSRPDSSAVPTGLALAAVLGGGALVFSLTAGLGIEEGLSRALRAALLVAVATWLRAAAGAPGLREVSRRALGRLSRIPAVPEAARTLDSIGSEGRLAASGRALLKAVDGVPFRPIPFVDAVLGWVAAEARDFKEGAKPASLRLRIGPPDALLLLATLAPAAALLA